MADLLRSSLLEAHGFAHGFSLRTGGVSSPPFDTLNLSRTVGDDPAAVEENHVRFAAALPVPIDRLFDVSQVHGQVVRRVDGSDLPAEVRAEQADALVTGVPGAAVAVRVADCVPILLADVRTGAVAAVHAGWRGAVLGVLGEAVRVMQEALAVAPRDLLAAIGPHIRVGSFEVGEDVAEQIQAVVPGVPVVARGHDKPHVDLTTVIVAQLRGLGLATEHIDVVPGCTFAEPTRFHSFRRDGQRSGRHLAAIVARS